MPTDKPRITFMIEPELKAEIEEFQFTRRMKNQSQAVLSLIEKGIQAELGTTENKPFTSQETQLISNYRNMTDSAQELLLDISERLTAIAPRTKVTGQPVPPPAGKNIADEYSEGEFEDVELDEAAGHDIDGVSDYESESDNDNDFDPA